MSYPFTRHRCYSYMKDSLSGDASNKTLCISGSRTLAEIVGLGATTLIHTDYPEVSLEKLPYEDFTIDNIVSDFVIEHVEADPLSFFTEQHRVLKVGGHMVCTTAFVYMYHGAPKDLWRFSEDTYKYLCDKVGFEVVKTGSWGSLNALAAIHEGHSDHIVGEDDANPLNFLAKGSDPRYPIVTWLIAKKK